MKRQLELIIQTLNVQTVTEGTPKSYLDVLDTLEHWHVKKAKYKVTHNGKYWWCFPKHSITGTIDEIYMTQSPSKNYYWAE